MFGYLSVPSFSMFFCQAIVVNPVDVMCNCYGSHVLRSLLCLCKGVPIDSSEFHAKKSSVVLAERLNFRPSHSDRNYSQHSQPGFPNLLNFLVTEMLKAARKDIATLRVDQYSSLVLQASFFCFFKIFVLLYYFQHKC